MATAAPTSTLKIAVLLVPPVQLLDLSPIDLFFMLSKSYLRDCQLPKPIVDRGLDKVEIYYVAESKDCTKVRPSSITYSPYSNTNGSGVSDQPTTTTTTTTTTTPSELHFADLTADLTIRVTHGLTAPEVAPGQIDILMVPGPDPATKISEEVKKFLREHAVIRSTHILSICTGVFVLGQAGLLDDKECTGPRALVGMRLKKEFPKAKWCERRWSIDRSAGSLWTAGGITNGQEMVAAYLRERFSAELADLVCTLADVGDRAQDYDSSGAAQGAWFVWIMARSFFKGVVGIGTKGGSESNGFKKSK